MHSSNHFYHNYAGFCQLLDIVNGKVQSYNEVNLHLPIEAKVQWKKAFSEATLFSIAVRTAYLLLDFYSTYGLLYSATADCPIYRLRRQKTCSLWYTIVHSPSGASQHLIAFFRNYIAPKWQWSLKKSVQKVAQYTRTYECLYTNGQNVHSKMHNEESGGLTRVDFDGVLLATELWYRRSIRD